MKRQDALFVDGGAKLTRILSLPEERSHPQNKKEKKHWLGFNTVIVSISYQFLAFQISCSILRTSYIVGNNNDHHNKVGPEYKSILSPPGSSLP